MRSTYKRFSDDLKAMPFGLLVLIGTVALICSSIVMDVLGVQPATEELDAGPVLASIAVFTAVFVPIEVAGVWLWRASRSGKVESG